MLTNTVTAIIMNQKSLLVRIAIFELLTFCKISLLMQKKAMTPSPSWQVALLVKCCCHNTKDIAATQLIIAAETKLYVDLQCICNAAPVQDSGIWVL